MRVIKELALTSAIKCTIFSWNGKYIIKLESGCLEQTYKVSEMDISGVEDVENLITNLEFRQKSETIFEQMNDNLDPVFS